MLEMACTELDDECRDAEHDGKSHKRSAESRSPMMIARQPARGSSLGLGGETSENGGS